MTNPIKAKFSKSFLCAVDGSSFSDLAFDCTNSLVKKNDHITLLHIYSNNDIGHNDPERLKQKYENKLTGLYLPSKYSLLWYNNDSDSKTVKSLLTNISEGKVGGCNPDVLVIGFSGWRFHNHSSVRSKAIQTLGSTTDFCLRNIKLPMVIVKTESRPGANNFVMAVNHSNASKCGLDILYTFLGPKDTLTVVNVYDDAMDELGNDKYNSLKEYYTKELHSHCPTINAKFQGIMRSGYTSIVKTLKDYLENMENPVDFVVIAPRARDDNSITSFTEQALLEIDSNIILCKM